MNTAGLSGRLARWLYRITLGIRRIGAQRDCMAFSENPDGLGEAIGRVYVINLDRHLRRWGRMEKELASIRSPGGMPLIGIAKRFSAIDARRRSGPPPEDWIDVEYPLEDQFFVEPQPILQSITTARDRTVVMTPQEIAIALSHLTLWQLIASSEHEYVLILEDDVRFRRCFARVMNRAWHDVVAASSDCGEPAFDVLYLSYHEAKGGAVRRPVGWSDVLFRPRRGLWHLSGYVVSRRGARKLLDLLPVRGPVDLWINHQFDGLQVFAAESSIVEQRRDLRSSNSYSVLPVLARLGLTWPEKPRLFGSRELSRPVFAFGERGTGATSLAMALSMLGYRCASNLEELPTMEAKRLLRRGRRIFDAYVNIGFLKGRSATLAELYPDAKFVFTAPDSRELGTTGGSGVADALGSTRKRSTSASGAVGLCDQIRDLCARSVDVLVLPMNAPRKWETLCGFLECEPPVSPYPNCPDERPRAMNGVRSRVAGHWSERVERLKWDKSPWIVPFRTRWEGIRLSPSASLERVQTEKSASEEPHGAAFDISTWTFLDDTFPNNLALFDPRNVELSAANTTRLAVRKRRAAVRDYTSAGARTRRTYRYGRFSAIIRPARVPGVVTGVFLHRNTPRQEIDIEILGNAPHRLLANVYYNPGSEGARMEYGYRGTPVMIDLGFDASEDFHEYSIEWSRTSIRWLVDGEVVHERVNWDPTPIPHLPMHFHVNVWCPRSAELAGKLRDGDLPAHTEVALAAIPGAQVVTIGFSRTLSSMVPRGMRTSPN